MKLRTVTLITIVGLIIAGAPSLFLFPWSYVRQQPTLVLSLFSSLCLYGSLLFFLFNLYLKGKE